MSDIHPGWIGCHITCMTLDMGYALCVLALVNSVDGLYTSYHTLTPPLYVCRGELASLRRHMGLLEVQKRETEMELQKLKRQVKDALGSGHGLLGGYLLQSVIGLLGGKTKNRYQKPAYTPVLSV